MFSFYAADRKEKEKSAADCVSSRKGKLVMFIINLQGYVIIFHGMYVHPNSIS